VSDRILVIGIEAEHDRIERAPFHAVTPLTEYASVIVDPVALPALWRKVSPNRHGRLQTNAETDGGLGRTLIEVIRRRRREAAELVRTGGTLACVLRPVGKPLYVERRSARGPAVAILHPYSWLPDASSLTRLVIAADAGQEMRPAAEGHPLWALLRAQGDQARFEACVANDQLDPDWHVVATDRLGRPVAFEVSVGEGRVLFLPPLAGRDAAERGALVDQLFAPEPEPIEPTPEPEWLADHLLPGQAQLGAHLAELEEQIENLHAEIDEVRTRHAELSRLSKLLYGRHPAELAEPVAAALRLLGFEVDRGEPECLDLRSEEGDAIAALTAAEGVIDPDPYWVLIRRLDAEGAPAKGLIIGNAFCTRPPDGRPAPFSDLLHRGAVHRDIALLSTLELHDAVAALIARPYDEAVRSSLRRALLTATGPCRLQPLIAGDDAPPAE
jgi:hypothetical protein